MSIKVSCPLQPVMSMVVQKKERSTLLLLLLTIILEKDHYCRGMARKSVQGMILWAVFGHVTPRHRCPRRGRFRPYKEATRSERKEKKQDNNFKWVLLNYCMYRSILVRASDLLALEALVIFSAIWNGPWLSGLRSMDKKGGLYFCVLTESAIQSMSK